MGQRAHVIETIPSTGYCATTWSFGPAEFSLRYGIERLHGLREVGFERNV
jgi:hypothetical protein